MQVRSLTYGPCSPAASSVLLILALGGHRGEAIACLVNQGALHHGAGVEQPPCDRWPGGATEAR